MCRIQVRKGKGLKGGAKMDGVGLSSCTIHFVALMKWHLGANRGNQSGYNVVTSTCCCYEVDERVWLLRNVNSACRISRLSFSDPPAKKH